MGQRQEIDHQPAGWFLGDPFEQPVEGPPIGVAREELVAVDEIEERHGLAPQGMDDVAIIDDMTRACRWRSARPRVKVISGVPPMNRSRRSSYSRTRSRWPISRDGTV